MQKPNYGYDAPEIVKRMTLFSAIAIIATLIAFILIPSGICKYIAITFLLLLVVSLLMPAIAILLGSIYFKFRERDWLLANLGLHGNETVLDVGCGHGLLLIGAAKKLKTGKAIGVDLWVQADQANNTKDATILNSKLEGVQDKVQIQSGDMRELPLPDASVDVVMSSWAIHNIYDEQGREKALAEIIRVLKPGGRIAILDIDYAPSYRAYFNKHDLHEVQLLGPRRTFGNKTFLVLADKS